MKSRITISVLVFLLLYRAFGQTEEREICGVLQDEQGLPLPGVTVLEKGTRNGTVTDFDGQYCITVPIGSTLVYSFIGFKKWEYVVPDTITHSGVKMNHWRNDSLIRNELPLPGEVPKGKVSLTSQSVSYVFKNSADYRDKQKNNIRGYSLYKIKYLPPKKAQNRYGDSLKRGAFELNYQPNYFKILPMVQYIFRIGFNEVSLLPERQNSYGQGNLVHLNTSYGNLEQPDNYSWGPRLEDKAYDPYQLFRPGFNHAHTVLLNHKTDYTETKLSFNYEDDDGILPGVNKKNYHFTWLENISITDRWKLKTTFTHIDRQKLHMLRGANMAMVMSPLFLNPPSFDIFSGQTLGDYNSSAHFDTDGNQHAYSATANNPLWLLEHNKDRMAEKKIISKLNLNYQLSADIKFDYTFSFYKNKVDDLFGIVPNTAGYTDGILSKRNKDNYFFKSITGINYSRKSSFWDVNINFKHKLSHEQYHLNRRDGSVFGNNGFSMGSAMVINNLEVEKKRLSNEWISRFKFMMNRHTVLVLSNATYTSNTLSGKRKLLNSPVFGVSIDFSGRNMLNIYRFDELEWFADVANTISEVSLVAPHGYFNSLLYEPGKNAVFYPSQEVINTDVLPEEKFHVSTGVRFNTRYGRYKGEFLVFRDEVVNSAAVVQSDGGFAIDNVATVMNKGLEFNFNAVLLQRHYKYRPRIDMGLSFTTMRSRVTDVYEERGVLPVVSIGTATSNIYEGKPYGVITGTRFKRDKDGNRVIGQDGFPLVDEEIGVIGNPNPDWTAGINFTLRYQNVSLFTLMDASYGAEKWNGTRNVMNYYGTSAVTGEKRDLNGQVMDGVSEDGAENTLAATFFDTTKDLTENRWIRYGITGVDEEAIEDASWAKLREVKLSYDFPRRWINNMYLQKLELSLSVINLLTFTKYKGVDPETTAFGYHGMQMFDYFNLPGYKSYHFIVNMKF